MYHNGLGVPQDYKQAIVWFTKAAEQGHAVAQYNLGVMYHNGGEGVPQDDKQATYWVAKAAKQGEANAQFSLGVMYNEGKGVLQNYKRAYMWLSIAVYNGYSDSQNTRDKVAENLNSQGGLLEAQDMALRCFNSGYKDC